MDERTPRIEIEVSGNPDWEDRVALRTFVRAADSLTELLTQIAADRPERVRVDWFVRKLRTGSAVVEVEGVAVATVAAEADEIIREAAQATAAAAARDVVRRAVEAIETLEKDGDVRLLLSYPAIEKVRSLTKLLTDGAGGIVIRALGREIPLTVASARRTTALLGRKYRSFGSVEGKIETLSVHQKRPYFNIFHALDGYAITCRCEPQLFAEAMASLGSRVRVSGEIVRRYDGRAETVDVSTIRVLLGRVHLPPPAQIRGILSEESNELTSLEEVRGRHG